MAVRNRLVINGSLGAGQQEAWSTGVTFSEPPGLEIVEGATALTAWANDVLEILRTEVAVQPLRSLLALTAGRIDNVVAYQYEESGPAVATGTSGGAVVAGSGTLSMPPQASTVFSLLTGFAGRSFRGRMYWPNQTAEVGNTLKMTAPTPAFLAAAMATFLQSAANAGVESDGFQPGVYSPTLDLVTPVTAVAVGDVIDTQRRRRDDLVEVYATVSVVP